jgi:hypothetical protein
MSEGYDTTEERGREERELNEQAAEHQAEEKRAEEEAEAIEQPSPPPEPTDPDQLRGEIAETREELGETVEALAAKTDVKAQAREKQEQAKAKVGETVEQAKRDPKIPIAAGAIALLLIVLLVRKRSR